MANEALLSRTEGGGYGILDRPTFPTRQDRGTCPDRGIYRGVGTAPKPHHTGWHYFVFTYDGQIEILPDGSLQDTYTAAAPGTLTYHGAPANNMVYG